MVTHALALAVATRTYAVDVHGMVRSIDRAHQRIVVRHPRHQGMNYEMNRLVKIVDRKQFAALRSGDRVDLRCDESGTVPLCVVRARG